MNKEIRLNKYIANCGVCSRRAADGLIINGDVTVNGTVVKTLGRKILPGVDQVYVKDKFINELLLENKIYIILYKPEGYISTCKELSGFKKIITDLLSKNIPRVYPLNRLPKQEEGFMLLTNDGNQFPNFGARLKRKYLKDYLNLKKGEYKLISREDFDKIIYENGGNNE